jgi:hypothetical protein
MNKNASASRAANLQAIFRHHSGRELRGRARRIGRSRISFTSHDHPVVKGAGRVWMLLAPERAGASPLVVEAECDAVEVVHAADAIRVEFRVVRWGANDRQLFARIGLRD